MATADNGDELAIGTKARLLSAMDDIEVISRQLLEVISNKIQNNQARTENTTQQQQENTKEVMDAGQLTKLLVAKEKNVKELAVIAREQYKLKTDIDNVKRKLEAADERITCMHDNFKNAEILQATTIYHAKELLKKMERAQAKPVGSEDLVKYAHKISASCSTVAPLNWSPGDPRRPYPQDIEMKLGWLGQCSNMRVDPSEAASGLKPLLGTDGITFSPTANKQQQNGVQQNWSMNTPAGDMLVNNELKNLIPDEADVMSSDSSSSDSSDSSLGND